MQLNGQCYVFMLHRGVFLNYRGQSEHSEVLAADANHFPLPKL